MNAHEVEVKLGTNGIKHPIWTYEKAHEEKLRVVYACAMLMMESSGGLNEFGSDWDFQYAGQTVTKARYEALRAAIREGHPSDGVGPCQLTSVGLLDEADSVGGAWMIPHNMAIGFRFLHGLIEEHGPQGGFTAYNGSGPAAEEYGARAMAYAAEFERLLN